LHDRRSQLHCSISAWCERFAVTITFVVFVAFRAADRAFLYRVQKYLQQPVYNLVLLNLIWPVSIQIVTLVMLLGYVLVLRAQGFRQYTWRFLLPGNVTASAMGAVPIYQLALFSLGDQTNAAMSAPPGPFVALPMQSIMTNCVLVWMLLLAYGWLHTRFEQVHYVGCLMVILSVFVGVSQKLQANDCSSSGLADGRCLTAFKNSDGHFQRLEGSSMALWYGLFILGTLPTAVGNCYKQRVLKGQNVDIIYATWWSGNFQVLWGLLLFWVNWIPLPDQPSHPPSATLQMLSDAWRCFIGEVPHAGDESCEAAGGPALKWFIVYLCFNLTFNICLLWLTKRMSAVWAQIATTLCLDLTNILSQYKFVVGASAQAMSLSEWLATILASLALWTYNIMPEIRQQRLPDTAADTTGRSAATQVGRSVLGNMTADGRVGLIESISFGSTGGGVALGSDGVRL